MFWVVQFASIYHVFLIKKEFIMSQVSALKGKIYLFLLAQFCAVEAMATPTPQAVIANAKATGQAVTGLFPMVASILGGIFAIMFFVLLKKRTSEGGEREVPIGYLIGTLVAAGGLLTYAFSTNFFSMMVFGDAASGVQNQL